MRAVAPDESVAQGYEALATGDWPAARAAFEAAVGAAELPEALDGLGRALWWLRDAEQAVVFRERAYSGFRRDGELARAARVALWLSREYALVWGNNAAANGWLARAERLLADVAPDAEQGWRPPRSASRSTRATPTSSCARSRSSAWPRSRSARSTAASAGSTRRWRPRPAVRGRRWRRSPTSAAR
jgi:hypothetical protein